MILHQCGQSLDAGEVLFDIFGLRVEFDAVLLLQGDADLQRIDGVQAKSLVEQRVLIVDIFN